MLNEGIEIAITVEQSVAIFDATRSNQSINRLPDGHSERTQMAEIASGLQSYIRTHQRNDGQRGEQCFRLIEIVLADKALHHFGVDQGVGHSNRPRSSILPHRLQIALPIQPAPKATDFFLAREA